MIHFELFAISYFLKKYFSIVIMKLLNNYVFLVDVRQIDFILTRRSIGDRLKKEKSLLSIDFYCINM